MTSMQLFRITEVHNFGGFFGGDTVTFSAVLWPTPGEPAADDERTLTVDEQALTNVRERHTICAGMVLGLIFAGERVEHAELLAAGTHAELRAALGPPSIEEPLAGPLVLSYRCQTCGLWVAGAPTNGHCRVCGGEWGMGDGDGGRGAGDKETRRQGDKETR